MSLFARISNVWRTRRLSAEIDEELASHLDEAIRDGRDPAEARRAFGSSLHHREHSRDLRILPWLDALRADAVFGWRQLMKRKVTSAAAILSLGIAIGACTAAFRLIDAVLLRPLPVANSDRLYLLSRQIVVNGKPFSGDTWAYPDFRLMRAAAHGQAELIAVSYAERVDLTYKSDSEIEKAHLQYVSGWMFSAFGLHPAAGRLFDEDDDRTPRAHPYAVLSQDYWASRFASDPNVVGRNVRIGDDLYTITGVVAGPFTGTEPGTITDIFVPASMQQGYTRDDASWCRTLAVVNPGVPIEPLRQKLDAVSRGFESKRIGNISGAGRGFLASLLSAVVRIEPAAAGASGLQQGYRRALEALAVLVALVLLIACANVANLLTAQSAARAREMALRVSIGAGRWRLVQLVLVESAWLGSLAAAVGTCFAWWSTPFVVSRINPPDNPARIVLPADARVFVFGLALTFAVTLLFGLLPALRASSVRPASALRGGSDPHARRRLMGAIVALQVAFCVLVVFVAGLFTATFNRLSHRSIGFSTARLLAVETVTRQARPIYEWDQLADHLRSIAGVERVALAGWTLPGGNSWNGVVSINGAPAGEQFVYFLPVAPGWFDTMKLPLIEGRDFRDDDVNPGAAIVNQTFVRIFFAGRNPVGQFFLRGGSRFQIVGVAADAPYRDIHEPTLPVAWFPIHALAKDGGLQPTGRATFLVRTAAANPLSFASLLRRTVSDFRPAFRASNIRTEQEFVDAQTVRERLLAMLAVFFAFVALLLSAVGLYGVLDYAVVQRSREIGIRRAIGARSATVVRLVTANVLLMMLVGAFTGVALALASSPYLQSLLYQVSPTEWDVLLIPAATILLAASLAALPAVIRAIRIDPARILRAD